MSTSESPKLDTLNDLPELTVAVGGREYHFSELTMGRRAELQAYLRRTTPHPIDAIKPHLEGLPPEDRQALLENARREARGWPPDIGTPSGMAALLATEAGQVEALAVALSMHHPGATRADAEKLYREMARDAARESMAARRRGDDYDGDGAARRIYAVMLGMGDPSLSEDMPLPEGSGPDRTRASIGARSTAGANGN